MLVYVIRHGETKANTEGYLQGHTDDPLNENGRRLALITGRALRGIHFDACVSSPLKRAMETADIILRESGNAIRIELDPRIQEVNMGEWERRHFRPGERDVDEDQIKLFFTDPFLFAGFPGGENTFQVCKRTQDFLNCLTGHDQGKTYLVVTHGFALRCMLNRLYDDPSNFWHGHVPYNCAVNIIEAKGGVVRLIADDQIYYDCDDVVDQYARF